MEANGQLYAPAALNTGRKSLVNIGWTGSRIGLDVLEKKKNSFPN
jgi:hypothetical protein